MGILDRIFGGGGDSDEPLKDTASAHLENPEESNILLDPEDLEGKVNIDQRAAIIEKYYGDISTENARFIAEILKEYIEGYDLQKYEAINRIEKKTGLNRERVNEIFWTERSSTSIIDNVISKKEVTFDLNYTWQVGADPCSPICSEVEEITTNADRTYSPSDIQDLLKQKAEEYEDQGGTPGRVDHWVAHHKCKATLRSELVE